MTRADLDEALRARFGESQPSGASVGQVVPLRGALALAFPGLCIYVAPPRAGVRDAWLHVTCGLSPAEKEGKPGLGVELVVATREAESWPSPILGWLIDGLTQGQAVSAGAAMACRVCQRSDGSFVLSGPDSDRNVRAGLRPVGTAAGILAFPYLAEGGPLVTASGPVGLLAITFAPEEDLQLAWEASSAHVLLLARELGVGQVSDLSRQPLISLPKGSSHWSRIAQLEVDQVMAELGVDGSYPWRTRTSAGS